MSDPDRPLDEEAVARAELAMLLRRENVAGRETLAALESVPRALFLSAADKSLAYQDRAAPIECGQTISQPTIVAMMTDALGLSPASTVLEVGTGSGYQTAVLARLAGHVYSIERYRTLSALAGERLAVLKLSNVALKVGDGFAGWPEHAPYDAIIMTAATEAVPGALARQLAPHGVLVAPIGAPDEVQALTVCRHAGEGLVGEAIAAVRFVPMLAGVAEEL